MIKSSFVKQCVKQCVKQAQAIPDGSEWSKDPKDYKTPAALLGSGALVAGGGAWAGRASKDMDRLVDQAMKWGVRTHNYSSGGLATGRSEDLVKALNEYIAGSKHLLQSRVGGLPVANMVLPTAAHIISVPQDWNLEYLKKLPLKERIRQTVDRFKGRSHHFKTFYNKDVSDAYRQQHLLHESYTMNDEVKNLLKTLPKESRDILGSETMNVTQKMRTLERMGDKNGLNVLNKALRDAAFQHGGQAGSLGHAAQYVEGMAPAFRDISSVLKGIRYGAPLVAAPLAIAGLATAYSRRKPTKEIKTAADAQDEVNPMWWGAPALAAGGAGTGLGIQEMMRPLNVGHSWAEMPDWGEGHRQPGIEGMNLVRRAARETGLPIKETSFVRNQHGLVPSGTGRQYFDFLLNTGGGGVYPNSGRDMGVFDRMRYNTQGSGVVPSDRMRVAPGGYMSYMTDIADDVRKHPISSLPGYASFEEDIGGGRVLKHKGIPHRQSLLDRVLGHMYGKEDTMLTYGDPKTQLKGLPSGMKEKRMGLLSPFVSSEAAQTLKGVPKEKLLDSLNDIAGVSEKSRAELANRAGKKIVVVSGSGRGDLVAGRVLELREALAKAGKLDSTLIIAAMAGSAQANPLTRVLEKTPGVVTLPRLPKPVFQSLAFMGDTHIGSSGTSSAIESTMAPSKFIMHPSVDKLKYSELNRLYEPIDPAVMKRLDELAPKVRGNIEGAASEYQKLVSQHVIPKADIWKDWKGSKTFGDLFPMIHKDLNMDEWNVGNKALYSKQPGAYMAQTPEEWIKIMDNPDLREAKGRAPAMLAEHTKGVNRTVDLLKEKLMTASKMKGTRGMMMVAAGLPMVGLGSYGVYKTVGRDAEQHKAKAESKKSLLQRIKDKLHIGD